MHTSRVSSPRFSASRVFVYLETASLYSSPTRLTRLLPQLIFHCATVFYAPRRHSRLLARRPHPPTTLDSPRARLAASCISLAIIHGVSTTSQSSSYAAHSPSSTQSAAAASASPSFRVPILSHLAVRSNSSQGEECSRGCPPVCFAHSLRVIDHHSRVPGPDRRPIRSVPRYLISSRQNVPLAIHLGPGRVPGPSRVMPNTSTFFYWQCMEDSVLPLGADPYHARRLLWNLEQEASLAGARRIVELG
jgi:hypothetical protein